MPQSSSQLHILELKNSEIGVTEDGADEFDIRTYFVQHGFTVDSVAVKASGHIFMMATGSEAEIEKLWGGYHPKKVNPIVSTAEQVVYLHKALPDLKSGKVTDKVRDETLAVLVELALKAYGVS